MDTDGSSSRAPAPPPPLPCSPRRTRSPPSAGEAAGGHAPRRALPPGRALRRPRPRRDHAAHQGRRRRRRGRGAAGGRTRSRLPPRGRAPRHPHHAAIDHSVKARVTGLKPHQRYYYRFETRDRHSPVGRFQTALPPDSRETVRFGFFSCADFTHGYYNAYELLAREDLDFVISLGDYVYAETYNDVGDGRAVRDDRIGRRTRTTRRSCARPATLPEYRAKYALYRSDSALREIHATFPVVATLGRPRGGQQLRQRRRGRRADAAPPTSRAPAATPPTRRSSSRCRSSRAAARGSTARSARAHGGADHARRAPVPRRTSRAATRSRSRAAPGTARGRCSAAASSRSSRSA